MLKVNPWFYVIIEPSSNVLYIIEIIKKIQFNNYKEIEISYSLRYE